MTCIPLLLKYGIKSSFKNQPELQYLRLADAVIY